MKHTKNFLWPLTILLCLTITLSVVAHASTQLDIFVRAGQIAKEKLNQNIQQVSLDSQKVYATGNDFTISREYFDLTVEEFLLSGVSPEEAKILAEKTLFEKYSLFFAAQKAHCVVDDSQVYAVIEDTKNGIGQATNKSDFYNYLDGMGLTEDEYWKSQFENIKMYESITAYQETCYQSFVTDQAATLESCDSDSVVVTWENYWANIIEEALKEQNIVKEQ